MHVTDWSLDNIKHDLGSISYLSDVFGHQSSRLSHYATSLLAVIASFYCREMQVQTGLNSAREPGR